ncbi:unnamed protein product, partial [Effrenium voratum]
LGFSVFRPSPLSMGSMRSFVPVTAPLPLEYGKPAGPVLVPRTVLGHWQVHQAFVVPSGPTVHVPNSVLRAAPQETRAPVPAENARPAMTPRARKSASPPREEGASCGGGGTLGGRKRRSETTRPKVDCRRSAELLSSRKAAPEKERSPPWPVATPPRKASAASSMFREEARDAATPRRSPWARRGPGCRAESPHDCIASRSPEPEMDGVMRRAGAGRSSGGGPSSICLGDPGQSKRPQRAFSADVARSSRAREDFQAMRRVTTGRDCEETSPDPRARSPRESARSMREEALDRARSPREDAAQSARSPRRSEASWRRSEASARGADFRETASWRRPSEAGRLGYEELEEENWRLREEVGRLRGELEKCAWDADAEETKFEEGTPRRLPSSKVHQEPGARRGPAGNMEGQDSPGWLPLVLIALSSVGFSVQALMVRELTLQGLGTFQILMVRGLCQACGCCLALLWAQKPSAEWLGSSSLERKALFARGLVGYGGICFGFLAISLMHLADSQIVAQTAPIFSAAFARIFLKEPWHCSEFFSAGAGIAGVAFIAKPQVLPLD